MRIQQSAAIAAIALGLSAAVSTQDAVDLAVVDRIKAEAFARSEVMDHLRYLTDVHGPRLTGSPQFEEAAKWATRAADTVRIEQRPRRTVAVRAALVGRAGTRSSCSRRTTCGWPPCRWPGAIRPAGAVTGEPLLTPLELVVHATGRKRLAEDFDVYRRKWTGKLRGRIVLFTPAQPNAPAGGSAVHSDYRCRSREIGQRTGTRREAARHDARRHRVAGQAGRGVQACS